MSKTQAIQVTKTKDVEFAARGRRASHFAPLLQAAETLKPGQTAISEQFAESKVRSKQASLKAMLRTHGTKAKRGKLRVFVTKDFQLAVVCE